MVEMNGRNYEIGDRTICLHCNQEVVVSEIVDDWDTKNPEQEEPNYYFLKTPKFKHSDPNAHCKPGCGAMGDPEADIIRGEEILRAGITIERGCAIATDECWSKHCIDCAFDGDREVTSVCQVVN